MLFNLSKVFIALSAAASVAALPSKRDNTVTCDLVLKPDVYVDSSSVNLLAEFNYCKLCTSHWRVLLSINCDF